ncbi:MAG TPA: hypothetical protein VFH39_03830 [Candidatus Saccharimonadales bacterium]|nr:hypothetical protein [Candidatus Saccharimonadales bacterium]
MKIIEVKNDPLTVRLPEWIDTNQVYEAFWSLTAEQWLIVPTGKVREDVIPF